MNSRSRKVFVVDDDEAVRASLALLLAVMGYTVKTFASAHEFLQGMDLTWEGCVLVDIHMPGMSGLELIARVRDRGLRIPAIVMTADVSRAVPHGLPAGATVPVLHKPFSADQLMEILNVQLCQAS